MSKTQDIHDATACLRQFQSSPEGCSASDIASAEGIPLERCNTLLARLQRAAVIQPKETQAGICFTLAEDVTALHVLQAVWAPQSSGFQVLFERHHTSVAFQERWSRGQWPQG